MRRLNSKLVMNFISEKGNDQIEKTYVAYTPLENFMCIAIAESYDNETAENSAKLAVEAALTAFERRPSLKRVSEYIRYANRQLLLHSTRYPLKASITVLVTDYTRIRYGICGNTKIYELYENLFTMVSKTKTRYQQLIDEDGSVVPDLSEIHNLTEYLGKGKHVRPYISGKKKLTEGSVLLFATSNLWGRLSEVEILDACENAKTNEEFLDSIQELLLSLQGQDSQKIGSYTAAVLSIEKVFQEDVQKEKKKKRLLLIAVIAFFVILLLLLIAFFVIRARDRSRIREIQEYDEKGIQYTEYENYTKALNEYEQAFELTDKLSLHNFQYIDEKKELIESITDKKDLLTILQEGETALAGKDYEQAKKLYEQIQKEAAYLEMDALKEDAKEKLEEIAAHMEIAQLDLLGDMYASTEEYEEALGQYEKALELLNQVSDLETQAQIQAKVFDIRQKQKEAAQAEQAAKEEKEEKKKEQAEEKKQKAANKIKIQINTLIDSANNALKEGRVSRAKTLYQQALAKYKKFNGSDEDAEKLYTDIAALGQAIIEAEVKAEEEAEEEQLTQAAKYILQAKEAAKDNKTEKAIKLYEKALKIYQELNIWDERAEAVYDAIAELEKGAGEGTDN